MPCAEAMPCDCSLVCFAALSTLLLKPLSQGKVLQEGKPPKAGVVTQPTRTCIDVFTAEAGSALTKRNHIFIAILYSFAVGSITDKRPLCSGDGGFCGINLLLIFTASFHRLSFQMHVVLLCRKTNLGLRWLRNAHTANASGVSMCC